ncbi:MAG: serine--tRNA ligase [Candidatus Uhrbacteria bacterium]|nr:serine--tRNA ligase [Candidatus Uhrbacteria bacterium]
MIDIKLLREDPKFIIDAAKAKNVEVDIDRILELDRKVKALKSEIESIAAQKNEASGSIASAEKDEKKKLIDDMTAISKKEEELKASLSPLSEELDELLFKIPNPSASDVTVAVSEDENEVIRTVGEPTKFKFTPKDHIELGKLLDIIDTESASKASASRFVYLKGDAVMLQFALMQYALQTAMKHGFVPVVVPHLINAKAMRAMGYLEHGGHDEIYYLAKDNMYLIGTSEQALGPMHIDKTIDASELPLRYIGYSPCYRREAGSYGKDTKGIIRLHQFDKMEMFSVTKPENSDAEHELILSIEEELMQGLGIPYQVLKMVSGDLGLPAARKYDIEAWVPSQEKYRETHSCSTTTDFQARRLNTKFKEGKEKPQFVHMLNGTAFAIGRTIVAILENFQQEDGSVIIPEVLRPFMGKDVMTPKA